MNNFTQNSSDCPSRRVAWPIDHWPSIDQLAWQQARQIGNPKRRAGRASKWQPASIQSAVGAYGRWLAFLADQNLLDVEASPGSRVTFDNMCKYFDHLETTCASVTIASYFGVLHMMLRALAPQHDWAWLLEMHRQITREAVPTRNKRMRIVSADELLALGLDLMEEGRALTKLGGITRASATRYRDGLMVAFLTAGAFRQGAFLGIRIGHQLKETATGYIFDFSKESGKRRRLVATYARQDLAPMLKEYLLTYRPFLIGLREVRGVHLQDRLAPAGDHLWVSNYGTALGAGGHNKALRKHTTARFGRFINPHLFRDCVVTTIATHDPARIRMAAQILNHTSLRTTEKHYIQAQANIAFGRYDDILSNIALNAKSRVKCLKRLGQANHQTDGEND